MKRHYGSGMSTWFCCRPFEIAEIGLDGSVYLCCSGWVDGPIGNLNNESLGEVWNGPGAQRFRQSIHTGSFSCCCDCPYLQHAPAGPIQDRSKVSDARQLRWIVEQTTYVSEIFALNLAYDRSCNLSCPSCRNEIHVWSGRALKYLQALQARVLYGDMLSKIRRLYLSGSGDPFASKTYRELLRQINPVTYPNLSIRLHTNAVLFDCNAWEAIGHARNLVHFVAVSIDAATAETYAVNRRGGNWDTLMQRLEFIASLRRDGPVRDLKFCFVVQANNFREIPAFIDLSARYAVDSIVFTPLRNWGTYAADAYRQRAVHLPEHSEHSEYLRITRDIPMVVKLDAALDG